MKPIETAADLYREIKKRGLHLRADNGRDNALIAELCNKLGCNPSGIQKYLDSSGISAQTFLKAFLEVARPFSMMFSEIWHYLSANYAPKASEKISIRFGFPDEKDGCLIDLEEFRRYAISTKSFIDQVVTELWPNDAIHELFEFSRIMLKEHDRSYYDFGRSKQGHYHPGKAYTLPEVVTGNHPCDQIVSTVRDLFQKIIDDYEDMQGETQRNIPEIAQTDYLSESADPRRLLRGFAYLLTDLLPSWCVIFTQLQSIRLANKDLALEYYNKRIMPSLDSQVTPQQCFLLEALDILDLPFWKHRWHTYEIWASVKTLCLLEDYNPRPVIINKGIPLDGYVNAIIADLDTKDYSEACVGIQIETPYQCGRRKAIKPDMRVCYSKQFTPDQTAVIIELKQRNNLQKAYIDEIFNAYCFGSPRVGGVLILNYDETGLKPSLPDKCYFLENVHPANRQALDEFKNYLKTSLADAGLLPEEKRVMLLLDVSGSMGNMYLEHAVQESLRRILQIKWIKILRFNDGLVPGGDLSEVDTGYLPTSGNTELKQALDDIERLFGLPDKMLIVTDGGHDHPDEMLKRIPQVLECLPYDLGKHLDWLCQDVRD